MLQVEEFAAANGRLPAKKDKDLAERSLAHWLYYQWSLVASGRLRGSRMARLQNSSSLLVRERVEGWLSKDPNCRFKRWCLWLKHYMQVNGRLPRRQSKTPGSVENTLSIWLRSQRSSAMRNDPHRRAMLESVHPLVGKRLEQWDTRCLRVNRTLWQARLQRLVSVVEAKGWVPLSKTSEYSWLKRQLSRLGQLPDELVEKLRKSHPLIAVEVEVKETERVRLRG